jgi:profilin
VATGNLDKAAIFNSEGDSVWATSAGFVVSPAETKEIVSAYKDKADVKQVQSSGLHIAGEKFVVLRADDRSIYGKKVRSADLLGKTCSIATEQSMLPASL